MDLRGPARCALPQPRSHGWDGTGKFCDRGDQYRPAILYASEEQKAIPEESREDLGRNKPFSAKNVTSIEPLRVFNPADDYHQSSHNKNPVRYKIYKDSCGRPPH